MSREFPLIDAAARSRYSRRALLAAAAAGIATCRPWPALADPSAVGLVKRAQGAAFLGRGGGTLAATAGSDVFLQDVAQTKDQPARLELQLGKATRIRLGANASLQVADFVSGRSGAVDLQSGAAFVEHDKSQGEPDFTVRSPYGLLAARGTSFFAGPSNGVFGVFVRNGIVDVRTPAGSVTLSAGEGTDIAAPGAAPTPPKRWKPPRVRAALVSVS